MTHSYQNSALGSIPISAIASITSPPSEFPVSLNSRSVNSLQISSPTPAIPPERTTGHDGETHRQDRGSSAQFELLLARVFPAKDSDGGVTPRLRLGVTRDEIANVLAAYRVLLTSKPVWSVWHKHCDHCSSLSHGAPEEAPQSDRSSWLRSASDNCN